MPAELIDGKLIAKQVEREVSEGVAAFRKQHGRAPALRLILVGDDADSHSFVRSKDRVLVATGIASDVQHLPAGISEADLCERVRAANADPEVDAILIQLPLPASIDTDRVLATINPLKDVDGLTPHNAGLLALGKPGLVPGTPRGCLRLLDEVKCELAGKRALVIGRSALVGRPMALLLLARGATLSIAHSQTTDLDRLVSEADVVIAAAGKLGLVRGEWIKLGAVVLDVGLNRDANGKRCGDVDFAVARERASFITPVPGGVGPMTAVMLAANTLTAAQRRLG